jgi:hypothetical protein
LQLSELSRAKSDSKRKTHPYKSPVTLHRAGQFCKKIRGKLYYFGTGKKQGWQCYLDEAMYKDVKITAERLIGAMWPDYQNLVQQVSSAVNEAPGGEHLTGNGMLIGNCKMLSQHKCRKMISHP